MSLDPLASMSPSGRAFLARIGRRFGTEEVLAQARQTLTAHGRFGGELRLHGFSQADANLLAAAREAAAARSQSTRARAGLKVTDSNYVLGLVQAKNGRTRARSVLSATYRRLRATGGPDAEDVMTVIKRVLTETAQPGGDDQSYAEDLVLLIDTLSEPEIRDAVADSGGAEALAMATAALATLRRLDAESTTCSDDPEADAIDGLIVELARTAQFAAQAAAKEVGNRSIAMEFRLRLLG
ncbi:hypothetical protein [Enhygromyxa salina]|uniref:Uncharacterized protein n=1 Tax=Enhygromyxa salina TaxID=215803 RepID=A0A2S9YDE6_9BACT|nr:hypothetical protein [Enhygromyxa salina]PRQ03115.1 hypothetical protein ENSA7_53860 [Enhygromyxa salina]